MGAPQWIDVDSLDFSVMMLLEEPHLRWMPRDWPDDELGVALSHNRSVLESYLVRYGKDADWLRRMVEQAPQVGGDRVRRCEVAVMRRICDWLVYVCCPKEYDRQPFLRWDDRELLSLADFRGATVADIGSGTGRLLEPILEVVGTAFAVEPVRSLREYMKRKFAEYRDRLYVTDGLITEVPLPDGACDVVLAGHVFGDEPDVECEELERIAGPEGMVILCPGNNDVDNAAHEVLISRGYSWSVFKEPKDGPKRKYWRTMPAEDAREEEDE